MNRILLLTSILAVVTIVASYALSNRLEKSISDVESRIGSTFVLEGDTAIIIDYSIVRMTYILSNGKEVSHILVEKKP